MTSPLVASLLVLAALQAPVAQRKEVRARPIASPTAEVEVERVAEDPPRYRITLRPVDRLGRPLGAARGGDLALEASTGRFLDALEDRGDGSYQRTLELPAGTDPASVSLSVGVLGATRETGLAPAPARAEEDLGPVLEEAVAQARRDLARRLGVEASGLELADAEQVTWRDSSLGCPRPGYDYTQALMPGVRVRLRVGEALYHYHGDRRGEVTLCETPAEPVPVETH